MTIKITGTGSALASQAITNSDLEKIVDTSDEWIRERTGIVQRHVVHFDTEKMKASETSEILEKETVASLSAKAAMKALEQSGKTAESVDLIIVATCSPELMLPCCACQVQDRIGAINATAFDINAACSGFLFALETAYAYINSGIYKNALVIGAEVLSKLVDWSDRATCVLFGDGAGAAFVEKTESEDEPHFLSFTQGANGTKGMVLSCERTGMIQMNGQEVYRFAVRQVPACIEKAVDMAQLTTQDIDWFILHQANIRIIEAVAKRLKADISKFPMNLDRVGNMSSATIPVLLDECNRAGKLKYGQKIVLSGFGAGLTYGACVLQW